MSGKGQPKVTPRAYRTPELSSWYLRKTEEHTIGVSTKDVKGKEGESKHHVTTLTNGRDCHWPSLSGRTAVTRPMAGMVQSI